MAAVATITPVEGFKTLFNAYSAALSLRGMARSDDENYRANAAIEPLFDAVVTHPACDLSSIISKCSAICSEFGEGEVPSYLVEGIMHDLIAMEMGQ